ncbi:MAG TPA: ABC transporter ATP-binding protein [Myxococcaceae bacterium]|nr:ABC transporter ATP-binding protein [Myxococcaceae bacterium]
MDAALRLDGVTKRYGRTVALDRVSFQVRRGSCHGLVGPNGAGKTTTFGLAAGFLRPGAGTVRILGRDPHDRGTSRPRFGVLPQGAALPAYLDVGTLLTAWARLSGETRPEAAAHIALERVAVPEAWDASPRALSHGVAKRVALAQALLGEPALLLLDEPTAGLDPRAAAEVRALLAGLRGQRTVIISSHNLSELEQLCDAVTVLDHGRVVQDGTLAEVTRRGAEFSVQISRGDVPLPEVRVLPGVAQADLSASGRLSVRLSSDAPPAEDVIASVLETLLARGVRITALTQGSSLERRVLDVTAAPLHGGPAAG